jgi:flagellar biosynthesis protein FliR
VSISLLQIQQFFLAFTRIMAMLIQVPMLGGRTIPNRVKVGLGLVATFLLTPWEVAQAGAASLPIAAMAVGIARELLIGTLAGFAASLTFGVLSMTGEFMGLSGGFGEGHVLNPTFDAGNSALDQFFVMTAMLLFLVFNGHHLFIAGMVRTFDAVPLNSPLPALSADRLLRLTGDLVIAGTLLAMPVMGASLLADMTLGLLARVAPQVQVFFLGEPVKVAISLLAVVLALGILLPAGGGLMRGIGPNMLNLLAH